MRPTGRIHCLHLGRRRSKGPGNGFFQRGAICRSRTSRHLDRVLGGHRKARQGLEHQRLGAHPAPAPLGLGVQAKGHRVSAQVSVRCERHHRLVKGHAEVGSQGHLALRAVAQHLEGPHRYLSGRGLTDVRREDVLQRLAGAGGRQALRGQPKLLQIRRDLFEARQALQHTAGLLPRELHGLW